MGGDLGWPASIQEGFVASVAEEAVHHGVHTLVLDALSERVVQDGPTRELRSLLRESARRSTVEDALREERLRAILQRLTAAGVQPLILKGGGLAYTHYEVSHHRTRCDIDLLVQDPDVRAAEQVLEGCGYLRRAGVAGRLIGYESTWESQDREALDPQVDLHWRASNIPGFAEVLTFEELSEHARPIGRLAAEARTPGDVHALLIAAMHLVGNDRWGHGHRLIWLYDLHLIVSGFDEERWAQAVRQATERGIRRVLGAALERTHAAFETPVPESVTQALASSEARREVTAGYMGAGPLRALVTDLRALPRWRDRVRLLQEHAFPPKEYLDARFDPSAQAPTWRLHVRRLQEACRRGGRS